MQFSSVFTAFILVAATGTLASPTFRAENQEALASAGAFTDGYDHDFAAKYVDLTGENDVYAADIAEYTTDAGYAHVADSAYDAEDEREVQLFSRALGRIVRHLSRHLLRRGLRSVKRSVSRGARRGARHGLGKIGRKSRSSAGRKLLKKTVKRTIKRVAQEEENRRKGQRVACSCCPRLGWIARDGEFGDDLAHAQEGDEMNLDEMAFDEASFDDAQPEVDDIQVNAESEFDQLD